MNNPGYPELFTSVRSDSFYQPSPIRRRQLQTAASKTIIEKVLLSVLASTDLSFEFRRLRPPSFSPFALRPLFRRMDSQCARGAIDRNRLGTHAIPPSRTMHIPDGILSLEVSIATSSLSVVAVGYSLRKVKGLLADRTIPLTGMMAALVFAGQMVNFPLVITSGHLLGGVLAATILGPWAGCIALTLVLVVQCFLFGDGGITALGANVLHMAVIGPIGGYAIYSLIRDRFRNWKVGTLVGAVAAAWLTVMAGAALFCIEFQLSQPSAQFDFGSIFTWMVSLHSLIGVGEALITGLVLGFVLRQRPDLIYNAGESTQSTLGLGRVVAVGTVCALAIAAFLAPFASSLPDGLDTVAGTFGFDRLELARRYSLLTDYEVPVAFSGWQGISVAVAGLGGTVAVLVIAWMLGKAFRKD